MTLSPMQESILRILADGPHGDVALEKKIHNGPESRSAAMESAHAAGLIKRSGKAWHLTAKGKKALPPRVVTLPQTVYQPPRVYRRPGSCTAHLPSLAAGRLYYPRDAL